LETTLTIFKKNKLSNNTDNKPIPTHKTEKYVSKKIFGFNEKREYGILETEIPKLEKRRTEYETQLSDTTLSVEKLNELSEKLGKLIQEIEHKTLRWFELSELQKN
jgi:ABC transport system ATP-binding/permease protein